MMAWSDIALNAGWIQLHLHCYTDDTHTPDTQDEPNDQFVQHGFMLVQTTERESDAEGKVWI